MIASEEDCLEREARLGGRISQVLVDLRARMIIMEHDYLELSRSCAVMRNTLVDMGDVVTAIAATLIIEGSNADEKFSPAMPVESQAPGVSSSATEEASGANEAGLGDHSPGS